MKDFLLSYDTVTLRPKFSKLESRAKADTSLVFCGRTFNLPVVPANMEDTIDAWNAKRLMESGHFYIYHRFGQENEFHPQLKTSSFIKIANEEKWRLISVSIGTKTYSTDIHDSLVSGHRIDFITIDVAHGHHEDVKEAVKYVRHRWPTTKLIVGNVATGEGAEYLARLGVDAIKVGIGGGSICTTRFMTGFHLPTLQSVLEVETRLVEIGYPVPIIADGGAKHYGDIAKALTFGATMVMSGRWFASCIDSPAKIIDGKKLYRGSTSYEAKGLRKHIEGKTLELKEGFTYDERLTEIKESLQSSISYAGGEDLGAFQHVQWQRVFPEN
jgi:GMP reductase